METIYTAKHKQSEIEFIFKYDLNGFLREFKKNSALNEGQRLWLYSGRFPETEEMLHNIWLKNLKHEFIIRKIPADLSFESLWRLYNHKVAKQDALKAFFKLKEEDVIKCFAGLIPYEIYLSKTKISKAHLSRYINARYFENEY